MPKGILKITCLRENLLGIHGHRLSGIIFKVYNPYSGVRYLEDKDE